MQPQAENIRMRPGYWHPSVELSAPEQSIVKRIKRAKLFTFLRQYRHQIFDSQFQEELNKLYADSPKGHPPVLPAQLALTTILRFLHRSLRCGSDRSIDHG